MGPLAAIKDFAGGVALQAVSECPWHHQAGIFQFWVGGTLLSLGPSPKGISNLKTSLENLLLYDVSLGGGFGPSH